jgi:hypothetical protein
MFRNGILLGLLFAIVALVVFGKTLSGGFNPQKGQIVVVAYQPYLWSFASGLIVGAAVPLALIIGIRYALVAQLAKHLPR